MTVVSEADPPLIQTPSSALQLLLYTYNTINSHVAKDAKNSLCENHRQKQKIKGEHISDK